MTSKTVKRQSTAGNRMSIGLGVLLEERYPLPEWALVFELSKGTGWRGQEGRCDAVAFNCYPSKGYHRLAFEMKTGRGDFLKELERPKKRAWVEENFHQTYFVTSRGVAKEEEIPEGWGLLVETQKGDALRRVKVARHRELPPLPETLALSVIRSMANRMHSYAVPFEFEGRKVTKEDIDRHIFDTLDAQRKVLDKQVKEANLERRRLQMQGEKLRAPLMLLANEVFKKDWAKRREVERDPLKYLTVDAVIEWLEKTVQSKTRGAFEEVFKAHEALFKLIEVLNK